MSNDLLAELARRARGPAPEPAWDALCRGELSEEERAALLASEGAAELAPLFEPLGPEATVGLADRVLAARADEDRVPAGRTDEDRAPAGRAAPADRPRRVPPTSPPPRRSVGLLAAPWRRVALAGLAVAAAALLLLAQPAGDDPLPAYTLEAHYGDRVLRGEEPAGEAVGPGGRVSLVARPARDAGPVEVHARVRPLEGGEALPWGGGVEVSPAGSVRLTGVIGQDLTLAPGRWLVEVALTRPGGEGEERLLTSPLTVSP